MPPYSAPPAHYPFPALAAQAGQARMGGAREVVLACLMGARLATEARVAATELDAAMRAERAVSARGWFASLAVPAAVRAACTRLVDAQARDDAADLATALFGLLTAGKRQLDGASVAELERVVATLRAP